jgi:nicotinamidase-related amidase
MARVKLNPRRSVLVLIDIQPSLSKTIFEIDRVLARTKFLAKVAEILEIPILCTEQNPSRMGSTVPELAEHVATSSRFSKMSFSALSCPAFCSALVVTGRTQVVLTGLETHICVSQTAQDLIDRGFEVVVCPDAVSSRTIEAHKLGMERIRDAGGVPAHTEAVAYEWLGTADHPMFKPFLAVVKEQG